MIIKTANGYEVKSESTGRSFGKFGNRKAAQKRLQQIEYFKHKKK